MTGVSPSRGAAAAGSDALDLEALVVRFAALPAAEAEPILDARAAEAVAAWRMADATFWQRVKYRARQVRAVRRRMR